MSDPDKAIAMLEQARNEETLNSAKIAIGSVLLFKGEYDRFVEFSEDLPEDVQYQYFSRHLSSWAHQNVKHLIEQLDSLPSEKIKIYIVEQVKEMHAAYEPLLTAEQLEEIETHLTE